MGKNKAQRTKNNARPSSSGRSAQLLETSSFVGFPSSTGEGSSFSLPSFSGLTGLTLEETESQSVNPQLQLVLKKMNKKDAITRLKALQEFSELCQGVEEEEVKSVLRIWPRLFTALATDPDPRVRESTHKALHQLSKRAGRNIAPQLRALSGPWFVGQYDTFAPAASAASLALQEAFPGPKLPEAIKFCQKDIIQYMCENLLSQTVETVAYEKTLTAEEQESRLERVLSSNLQAYQLFLRQLPASELRQGAEAHQKLVTSPKFWKLSKHKSNVVRRSWFSALSALLEMVPFVMEGLGNQVAPAVFGNLDDSDPGVLPCVWAAALHALIVIKNCWSHVNCDKMVFPKLWHILRDGGQGNAAAIYPNLLPLLSKITPQDKHTFYSKFFSNMRTGLGTKCVQQSSSESGAVVTAYVECFRYVATREEDTELVKQLLTDQVMPLVEICGTDRRQHLALHPLASQVSELLQSWMGSATLSPLLTHFWDRLQSMVASLPDHPNSEGAFKSFSEFLSLLVRPERIKKARKVNFSTEEPAEKPADTPSTPEEVPYLRSATAVGLETAKLVLQTCGTARHPDPYIAILQQLTRVFGSEEYFEALAGSCEKFLTQVLQPWLHNSDIDDKPVVEMIFLVLKYLEPEEKRKTLLSFCKIAKLPVLQLCIEESILAWRAGDAVFLEWLRGAELGQVFVALATEVSNVLGTTEQHHSAAWSILKLAFSATTDGGLLITTETVSQILRVFCDALTVSSSELKDEAALDSCACFVSELTNSLFGSPQLRLCQATLQELLLATFTLCCSSRGLSASARESLQSAWTHGIQQLDPTQLDMHNLCEKLCKFAHESFTFANNRAVVCLAQFLGHVKDPAALEIFLKLPAKFPSWQRQLEAAVCARDIVHGSFYWAGAAMPLVTGVDSLFNYINAVLFNIDLLLELSSAEQAEEDKKATVPLDKFFEAVYARNISCLVIESYKNCRECSRVAVDFEMLNKKVEAVQLEQQLNVTSQLMFHAVEQMEKGHHLWMHVLAHLFSSDVTASLLTRLTAPGPWEPWLLWVVQAKPELTDKPAVAAALTVLEEELLAERNILAATYMRLRLPRLADSQLLSVCELLIKLKQQGKLENVFTDKSVELAHFVDLLRLLSHTVSSKPWLVTPRHWDALLCMLASWLLEAKNIMLEQSTNPAFAAYVTALLSLLNNVQEFMTKLEMDDELRAKSPKHLTEEWRSLFLPEMYSIVMAFFYQAIENTVPAVWDHFKLQALSACLVQAPVSWLITHQPPKHLAKWGKGGTVQDSNVEDLTRLLCSQLLSPQRVLQVSAFHLLARLVPELVEKDEAYRLSEDSDAVEPTKLSCELLGALLDSTHAVVETMLMDFSVGDCCIVEPFTDSHLYTQAYLLTWGVLLDLCGEAKSELRYHYTRWLSNTGYTNTMLEIVFRLMPDYLVHPFASKAAVTPSRRAVDMFTLDYHPSLRGHQTASGIQHAACWVYKRSLMHLPAQVRAWWTDLEVRVSGMVERLTACLVSPLVCTAEMRAIMEHEKNFSNMTVKVYHQVREVIAVYKVDEACMELTIALPANHPLGPVRVESNKPAIDISKWNQWVMQLTIFLTHQNGSLWDGLMLWKRNLDTQFEGVEECYICYSVLHSSSYQIPKLSCHTCHKKFHSSCLYRWFHTSNNSTCPICRNLF